MQQFYVNQFDPTIVKETLEKWGVCVITNYFTTQQATIWKQELTDWLCALSNNKLVATESGWKDEYLPTGPRYGMMQSVVSGAPTYWNIREALYPLYKELHGEEQLVTSLDGLSLFPIPSAVQEEPDWAHIDQTIEQLDCVQGQVVLSDSKAAFRCTPTSHLFLHEILQLCNAVGRTDNFLKFKGDQIEQVKKLIGDDSLWQLPIHAPAGSVILWKSSTIHSSTRYMELTDSVATIATQWNNNKSSSFGENGWRCVLYICMRPKKEFSKEELAIVKEAAAANQTTNHWATKIFPTRDCSSKASELQAISNEPNKVAVSTDQLSTLCKRLINVESW